MHRKGYKYWIIIDLSIPWRHFQSGHIHNGDMSFYSYLLDEWDCSLLHIPNRERGQLIQPPIVYSNKMFKKHNKKSKKENGTDPHGCQRRKKRTEKRCNNGENNSGIIVSIWNGWVKCQRMKESLEEFEPKNPVPIIALINMPKTVRVFIAMMRI